MAAAKAFMVQDRSSRPPAVPVWYVVSGHGNAVRACLGTCFDALCVPPRKLTEVTRLLVCLGCNLYITQCCSTEKLLGKPAVDLRLQLCEIFDMNFLDNYLQRTKACCEVHGNRDAHYNPHLVCNHSELVKTLGSRR